VFGQRRIDNEMASVKRRRHRRIRSSASSPRATNSSGPAKELGDVCRHLQIAESTWHRWLAQYGGMKANEAKRLKELDAENARLKKLVANQALDIDMLKDISAGNF
jgi:hypothetical protein